ncbi:MAG: SMC-Scp complex subunit ScpB [Candidatus Micrarchaeaceae archaeon]
MEEKDRYYKNVVLALLFAAGRSLKFEELSSYSGIASIGYLKQIIDNMIYEYKNADLPFEISHFEDNYELVLKEEYVKIVDPIAGKPELSKGALKILAYISKNEPILQKDIVKTFGESSYVHIKEIAEKGFINAKKEGRSKKLSTTSKFKEYFNLV